MPLVLLDTSALFASLDHDDRNYHVARRFFEESPSVTYVVPDTIFSEAMTLIKLRLGMSLATGTGTALLSGGPFHLHRLTVDDMGETWRIFSRYTDKPWSYADCSVLAIARRLKIDRVFAFDHHFDQMASLGLHRLP